MRNIIRYLKNYKKESILAPLFKMLEACFELFVPLVMAKIVDIGIAQKDMGYIIRMCLVMVVLGVVGLICSITAQFFAAKAANGFGAEVRKDMFSHITSLSYAEVDTIGTSTLLTRMTSDINQMQTGVNLFLRLFLRSPFIVFGAMIMAFTIDVKSATTFVVTIPLLSIVVFGIMVASIPLFKKVQERLDKVMLLTRESLEGARVIRAFNRQKKEFDEFDKKTDDLMGFQLFVGRISAFLNPVTYVIINMAIVALLWIAAGQVDLGIISQGKLIALVNYMSQILVELVKLANLIINLTKSIACGKRVNAVFAEKSSIIYPKETIYSSEVVDKKVSVSKGSVVSKTKRNQGQYKVEFQNVDLRYKNSNENSLSGINFSVMPGETVGIIGGTGSGKSSLINMIPRFYDAFSGKVKVDGIDVKNYNLLELRRKVGLVPQKAVLFAGTIADNIRWGKNDATEEEIFEALKVAQALDFVKEKENGINFPVAQGGKNLSGGQKQRLTIARAVVRKPEILILDDSSSALDFATDAKLREAITHNTTGMTVFIVSQRASTVMNADKIVILDDGEIAGIGTHEELIKTCDIYKEICQTQLSTNQIAGKSNIVKEEK